jgi:hypothetical protein
MASRDEGVIIPPDIAYKLYTRLSPREARMVETMSQPVRCRCGAIYDLGTVTVTARYADCSMWHTPCCQALIDDRGDGLSWPGVRYYTRLTKN